LPVIAADQLRQFSPPAKSNEKLRIIDSHEFIELYRGDKDLRVGKQLCRDYGCEYVQLGSDISSPADTQFFKTDKFLVDKVGQLPDSYYLLLLKSKVLFHRKGDISLGGFFRWSSSIGKETLRWQPDLIMESPYMTLTPRSYMTHYAARHLNIPLVYVDCGDIIPNLKLKHRICKIFEKPVVNDAAAVITYNEAGKKRFIGKYGYSEERIHVIPKPVDIQRFHPGVESNSFRERYGLTGKFVVAYFGRICKNKGAHYLLEAASIMHRRGTDKGVVFLFVGGSIDSTHAEYFQDKIRHLPMDNIKKTGKIFYDDMPSAYAAADIAVFPDVTNLPGFSTVLAESMAAGLPSIIGNRGWEDATPIKDGLNGIITKPGDAFELAEKIEMLRSNHEIRKAIGTNSLKLAREEMDYDKVVARYYELFGKLTGKYPYVRNAKREYQAIPA
jgi:glycosyltransferase involved in cell wall biosynthesis